MMKILIVDDEELICWALKRCLERHAEYSVYCSYTGSDALQKIMEDRYDVVITDLRLPDMSGVELIKKMKNLDINAPIIVISAYFAQNLDEIINLGVFRCIGKPFRIEDVVSGVKEAVA